MGREYFKFYKNLNRLTVLKIKHKNIELACSVQLASAVWWKGD